MLDLRMSDLIAAKQVRACRRHRYFMEYCWQREERFIVGYHTETICERIDRAIEEYRGGKSTFLMIKVPFRHGKSDMVSRYLPPHFLGEFPDEEVIVAGYSSSLTAEFSKFGRKLLQSDEYRDLYRKIRLAKDEQSVDVWGIDRHMGKAHWVGLQGSITGKGGSLIIIDDFFKGRDESESELIRDKVWESISNDIMTRRAPTCIFILLATPWHTDDPFCRIKAKMADDPLFPRFEELRFPARSEEYKKVNGTKYLFPMRFNEEWYEGQYSTLGPYASAGLLDCDPIIRHGNLFNIDSIKSYTLAPENLLWTRGWDLASSEKQRVKDDPDFTVSIKLGVKWQANPSGNPMPVLFIDDYTSDRLSAPKRDEKIKRVSENDATSVQYGIEAYGPYKDAFKNIEAALWGVRTVRKVQLPGDKVTRASVLEPAFHSGNVYMKVASWNSELIKQIGGFPGLSHDDSVDALVTAFALHKPYVKHIFPYMSELIPLKLNIHWGKKEDRTTVHYGAIVLKKDLSMYVLCCLWDDVAAQLFVYDGTVFKEPDVAAASRWIITHMNLKSYVCDRIICNDIMCESTDDTEKNMQALFREEFKKNNVATRLHETIKYDKWGSIAITNRLSQEKHIFFDVKTEPALIQCQLWNIDKNKPSQDDSGYCECLNLTVSELKRRKVFDRIIKKTDYVDERKFIESRAVVKE